MANPNILPVVDAPKGDPKPRVHFIDGLRAVAAFYVLLFHETTLKSVGQGSPSAVTRFVRACLSRGHFSVVFFIVLSGFSLMLPLARKNVASLPGSLRSYLYRRAKRILPPYYAALALSIGLIVVYNAIGPRRGWGQPLDAATEPMSVISHLFLFHNFSFDWAYRINGPMWSVATEWQIYFVFPLLLLPSWRRIGPLATIALAWGLGSLPQLLLPGDANFFWACPWFVGSFALGMAAAVLGFSPRYRTSALRNRVPWGSVTLALLAVLAVLTATGRADVWAFPLVDAIVSLFAFCWINACTLRLHGVEAPGASAAALEGSSRGEAARTVREGPLLRVLGSKTFVYLSGFSYSLYLVQHPILRFTEKVFARLSLTDDQRLALQLVVVTPFVVVLAWLFAEFFERPFTSGGILWPALRRRFARRTPPLPVLAASPGQDGAGAA